MKRNTCPSVKSFRASFLRLVSTALLIAPFGVFFALILCHSVWASDPAPVVSAEEKRSVLNELAASDPSLVFRAISKIKEVNIPATEALPLLLNAALNPSEFVRLAALNAIGDYGKDAAPAVPGLIRSLHDKDSLVREAAALALIAVGPAAREYASSFVPLLDDDNRKTREASVMILAGLGPQTIPQLMKVLEGNRPVAAASASEALARIGSPAIDPLIDAVKKGGPAADLAGGALAAIGAPAVKPLIRLLRDPHPAVSQRAERILISMGASAIEPLVEAVRSAQ